MVPFDEKSPFITSGIRIGTPAATTRGFRETEMGKIAEFIDSAIRNYDDDDKLLEIKAAVKGLCSNFPLYTELRHH
jgi:glycine hydroxymethyltransferase